MPSNTFGACSSPRMRRTTPPGSAWRSAIPLSPRERLTRQERQIAEMAATGLTNRQIGEQLFLSHRTVSPHLYRSFPKLGVTARAELRTALDVRLPATA